MSIEIKNYTKVIKKSLVLDSINLTFESGKIYGLKGKNGSGKTMLLRAICGLIFPTSGEIIINNEILGKDISFPKSIGVLIENPYFINNYSAYNNIKLLSNFDSNLSKQQIYELISEVGLDPESKKSFKKFSLGMKQRLGIASAIMGSPQIILMDEPTNALDDSGMKIVRNVLIKHKERGATIIIASHNSEELEYLSDEIYKMSDGKLIR